MRKRLSPYIPLWLLLTVTAVLGLFPGNYARAQAPQTPAPDCVFFINQTFTSGSAATISFPSAAGFDNRTLACQTYTFQYTATATSGSLTSLDLQAATGAVTAGSFSTWGGTVSTGINPNTANSGDAISTFTTGCANGMACTVANSWVQVLFTRGTFVGHIQGVLYGYRTGYARSGGGGGGAGTVTEVDTGCGLDGGPITTTGTIEANELPNAQTGTTYAVVDGDCGKNLTFANTANVSVSIAQAGTAGAFKSGWFTYLQNEGVTKVTLTPSTSTVDGAANLVLQSGQGVKLFSNGTNYTTNRGYGYNQVLDDINGTLLKSPILHCTGAAVCSNELSTLSTQTKINVALPLHMIEFSISGGGQVITTGNVNSFPTADFACTIIRTDVSANASGSITVDLWKAAGAIPTSMNKISASAPVTLSSAQLNQNGSISGWTTTVSAGDVFGASVATVATVQTVTVQIWCQ